jgi:hypothetical protein
MVWSETLSTPGMTVKSALRSKHGAGEASFHLQSSDDKFVAVGPNPDATNGPRYIVPVEFAVDICADHGDHVAYVNASAFTGVHVTYCFAGGLSWQGNTSSELANAMWSETLTVAGQTSNIAKEAPRRDVHGDGLFWVFATVDGYITLIQAADPTSVARIPIRARHFEAVSAQPGDRLAWLPA